MARYSKQKSRMNRDEHPAFVPMLKTVEQMALISGIGENKLRQLMADGELEFIQNGNRRLISDQPRQDPGKGRRRVLIWRSAREKSKTSETAKEF